MNTSIDRRRFLKSLSAAAIAIAAQPAFATRVGANEAIGLGIIGTGSLGRGHHLARVLEMPEFRVVALADVDGRHLDDAVEATNGRAAGHRDYRELLARRDVDAVLIATPDHWHALNCIHACEAGKDVYCEKPLSLTIAEGRAMVDAARRTERVVQVGTQQRSDERFHLACELVRNGRIGRLRTIKVVVGNAPPRKRTKGEAPPKQLDWDFWLGPAPKVVYHPARCHYDFRWFYDYSGGKLTDWGAHHLDIALWGLGDQALPPATIRGSGEFPADNLYDVPVEFEVEYDFKGGIVLSVSSRGENGITFSGTDGEVFVSREAIRTKPDELAMLTPGNVGDLALPYSRNHHRDWIAAIRRRSRPISDVETGHRSAMLAHLGNIAIRLGRPLEFDFHRERFLGDEVADRLISKPMRHPWSL